MPRFIILPTDRRHGTTTLIAPDAGALLPLIHRLECKEADVTEDGVYVFTLRLGGNGVWSIFERYTENQDNIVRLFDHPSNGSSECPKKFHYPD